MNYEKFKEIADKNMPSGVNLYLSVIENIFKTPARFVSQFSITPSKFAVVRNIEASRVIRLGNIIEDTLTVMLEEVGFINLPKSIAPDLMCDQHFRDSEGNTYLIEQKVRDDHDSTKKRGQIENFKKKVTCLQQKNVNVQSAIWFSDPAFKKNRKYYAEEISSINNAHLYYGEDMFCSEFIGHPEIYKQVIEYLAKYRSNQQNVDKIADELDTSDEAARAIAKMCGYNKKSIIRKMTNERYQLLLNELFPTRKSFNKAIEISREGRK